MCELVSKLYPKDDHLQLKGNKKNGVIFYNYLQAY